MNDVKISQELEEVLKHLFKHHMYLNKYDPEKTELFVERTSISSKKPNERGEVVEVFYYLFNLIPRSARSKIYTMVGKYKLVIGHHTVKELYVGESSDGVPGVIRAKIERDDGKKFDYQVFFKP